jgi:hypothetical protein
MNEEHTIQIAVVSDEDVDMAALGEAEGLERHDDQVEEHFVVIGAVLLIGAVMAAAKLVMRAIAVYRGGVQIEMNQTPPVIRRNKALPDGTYVIVAADGTVKIETHGEPEDSIERMTTAILKLPVSATVSTIQAAIKAAHPVAQPQSPAPAHEVLGKTA